MEIIRLLTSEERKGKYCYFCGETRSVKYVTNAYEFDALMEVYEPIEVCCCNRCILTETENET
jgi:hypothetical protein